MAEEDEDVAVGAEKVGKSEDVAAEKSVAPTTVGQEEDVVQHAEAGEDVVVVVEAGLQTREDAEKPEETGIEAIQTVQKTEVGKQYNPAEERSTAEEAPEPTEKSTHNHNKVQHEFQADAKKTTNKTPKTRHESSGAKINTFIFIFGMNQIYHN